MKRVMLVSVILLVLLWTFSVQAQDNLLTNPGFEPPFSQVEGSPPRQVAEGWQPWHIPAPAGAASFQNRQPEYEPTAPDTARIHGGSDAQQVFSFFATHVGGVYQTVNGIAPGTRLRFSVYAYVWSTTFEEVDLSEEDGDVTVEVGIDPNGGTDGQSASVVWSEPIEQYDAYNEYSIEADVVGPSVTVFVRTSTGVPVKHNNIYLDDASLTIAGDATAEPGEGTAEATAEPSEAGATPATAEVTAEPVEPSATAVIPSVTPVPAEATATPVTPSATPVPAEPTATQVTASATPVPAEATATATSAPVEATVTPVTPTATSTTAAPPEVTEETTPPISEQFPFTLVHVVAANEIVAAIAERYGSSVEAIAEANNLDENYLIMVGQELIVPVPTEPAPASPTPAQIIVTATPAQPVPPLNASSVYTVMPGDSLTRIARLFNTNVGALAQLNGIVNPNVIQVGQRLNIPGSSSPTPAPTATTSAGQPTATPQNTVAPRPSPTPRAGTEYIVRYGDSLYTISLRFGVPISRIAQANNIRNTWLIYAGQRLIIP